MSGWHGWCRECNMRWYRWQIACVNRGTRRMIAAHNLWHLGKQASGILFRYADLDVGLSGLIKLLEI